MDIKLVSEGGFCFGVRRAMQMAEDMLAQHGRGVTLGPLIHNKEAVERLASRDASPVSWDPIGSVEDAEVWAVVRSLPGEQAAAVALRYGADLSLEEVAATMEITPSAARSLLHRARRTLRERPDLLLHADRIRGAS